MKHGRQIYPDFDARLKNGTSPSNDVLFSAVKKNLEHTAVVLILKTDVL